MLTQCVITVSLYARAVLHAGSGASADRAHRQAMYAGSSMQGLSSILYYTPHAAYALCWLHAAHGPT